ncbi:MAG: hypothetical protein HC882_01375 [Acidobacteria bacterium]|nr:hypothetical protein [Acidobacteriota bacterium]
MLRAIDTGFSFSPRHDVVLSHDLVGAIEAATDALEADAESSLVRTTLLILRDAAQEEGAVTGSPEDGILFVSWFSDLLVEAEGVWMCETSRLEKRAVWLGEVRPSVGKPILDEP